MLACKPQPVTTMLIATSDSRPCYLCATPTTSAVVSKAKSRPGSPYQGARWVLHVCRACLHYHGWDDIQAYKPEAYVAETQKAVDVLYETT